MTIVVGDGCRLRRAERDDADFFVELATSEDVEPFLAASAPKERATILEAIERSLDYPEESGRFVIEVPSDDGWRRAGVMGFEVANRRSRIARLGGLAVSSRFRGRGLATAAARALQRHLLFDLGFHRLELECYGFNEAAIRHAEHAGFVREGVKRKAYRRHGDWVDGVLFAILREDLEGM